jgi:hypothetical protein
MTLKGDLVSKEFFLAVKERPQTANIASLLDTNGQWVTDRAGIERTVLAFYSNLYEATPPSPA